MTPQPKPSAAALKAASCFTPSDSPEEHLHANAAVIDAEFAELVNAADALLDQTGKYDLNFITSDNGECDRADRALRAALMKARHGNKTSNSPKTLLNP